MARTQPHYRPRAGFQLCANMDGDLRRVVVNEVSDPVMRDAPVLRPIPKCADGRLLACRGTKKGAARQASADLRVSAAVASTR